jgi:polysaccharide pyruvyl transferase WcaK-like protein
MELHEAIDAVMEGGHAIGVNYDDALEYAMQDARFVDICHELHGAATATQLFTVKGSYIKLLREKVEFLLIEAERARQEVNSGL